MIEQHYIEDMVRQLRKLKNQADGAIAQIEDEQLFVALDPESNSIAVIMKHMSGNMRSRWTDFLTSDGEKPDRQRDAEFEVAGTDSPAQIRAEWERGWTLLLQTVSTLGPDDLQKTIHIRGEAHTVVEAINRQAMHYAAHVGQIVLLAKHAAGPRWRSLSIPRGQSRTFDVAKSGAAYHLPKI